MKIEAYGVRGMKSRPWRRIFASWEAFEKWWETNNGEVEIYGMREMRDGSEETNNDNLPTHKIITFHGGPKDGHTIRVQAKKNGEIRLPIVKTYKFKRRVAVYDLDIETRSYHFAELTTEE